jgi:hypothetical protein
MPLRSRFQIETFGPSSRIAALLLFLLCAILATPALRAQTLTIRVLNAKSGAPFRNENITVDWVKDFLTSELSLGHEGIAHVQVPPGTESFGLMPGPKRGKEPDRIAYFDCNAREAALIRVRDVIETGVALGNSCGKATTLARPGEVVFWALPIHWWQIDFQ